MPYGLFDYGGTINTMGLSPIAPGDPDYFKNPSGIEGNYYGSQMVTRAIPEEAQITTAALYEEGNPYTDKAPEEGPIQQLTTMMVGEEEPNYNPTTLRMPEDGQFPTPPTGGTGGCPAGYAPSGGGGGGWGLPNWGPPQRPEILGFHSNPYGLLAGEYLTGAGSGDPFNIHGAGTTWIQTNK